MAGDFESLINIEENKVENLYIELIKQVEEKGELSPYSRDILWKMLEDKEDSLLTERKYVTLELNSIQKVIDCWTEGAPICTKLQELYQSIENYQCKRYGYRQYR